MVKKILVGIILCVYGIVGAASDGIYYGVKIGNIEPSFSIFWNPDIGNTGEFEPTAGVGFALGKKFDENLMVEGELLLNVEDGEIKNASGSAPSQSWGIKTASVYGVYRASSVTHLRIRAGLTYTVLDYPSEIDSYLTDLEDSSFNLSYGAGFGFDTSSGREFLVEWTQLRDDIMVISFGINF
jgi:hypothetical protein